MRKVAILLGIFALAMIAGCGQQEQEASPEITIVATPSPIAELVDFVKDDPSAQSFLRSWPFPESFISTGSPSFQRSRSISYEGEELKEVVRYDELHFSGLTGNLGQSAVLEFYQTALTEQGYEVTGGEDRLNFRSEKWSGEVTVSADLPPVINVNAEQN